jgi:hypothetical protein
MGIFSRAIEELGNAQHSEPRLFLEYLRTNNLRKVDTAAHISVQTLDGLPNDLKSAGVMVFRLGSPSGSKGTQFVLARYIKGWNDYFLSDEAVFAEARQLPDICLGNQLRVFEVIGDATETSLVNLAVASGALSVALDIDIESQQIIHTTAQGTYDFSVCPHPQISAAWNHVSGQVEIDAAFVSMRGGMETLFVVEAKVSDHFESLAKPKIAYPIYAVRQQLAKTNTDIPVIGVYLRAIRSGDRGYDLFIAECHFTDSGEAVASLEASNPTKTSLRRKDMT